MYCTMCQKLSTRSRISYKQSDSGTYSIIAFSLRTGAQTLADISCALGHSKQNNRPKRRNTNINSRESAQVQQQDTTVHVYTMQPVHEASPDSLKLSMQLWSFYSQCREGDIYVIRPATAFMCLHVSKRCQHIKVIVQDRQKKRSLDGAGL
jgi:hypothetical protein